MLKLFLYDNEKKRVVINEPDLLLIKEFNALFDNERNITETDKTGQHKQLAFKELHYIYLAIDWRSPYKDYLETERYECSLFDSGLTSEQFEDETFRAACRKYEKLQAASKVGSLLQAQYNLIDRMTIYYNTIDLDERKEDGSRINKTKDIIAEMSQVAKALDGITQLEDMWKKEQEQESQIRGDNVKGFMD